MVQLDKLWEVRLSKIKPIKHVPLGLRFTGVTHAGRVIPLGKVISIGLVPGNYPHHVRWYDENGKHYENFNLHNPAEEFREFTVLEDKHAQA